jgi:undecaprenyl-diphosphatase
LSIYEAVILAIIEGITEFLPVSSTGHMIIASSVMNIASDPFVKMFTVAIQFGAILSVIVLYLKRFFQSHHFYLKLFVAFLPAAVFGKLFNDAIDALLENAVVVAITLLLGGIVLLFVDRWFRKNETDEQIRELSYMDALKIGIFQVIAMIPGVSRSAATIIGGLSQRLTRKAAAEFSFFLAVPTMFAATAYKMFRYQSETGFQPGDVGVLVIGNLVAFIVAMAAIKGFIAFLTRYGFRIFGWYRIVAGSVILLLYAFGYSLQVI